MARALHSGGVLAAMMGIAFIVPVIVARMGSGRLTELGIGFVAAGCGLIVGGVVALVAGFRRRPAGMPSSVRAAVAATVLFLAFLALELSDRSVCQDGKRFYWTTFLLPPTLLLFVGLVAAKAWAWWVARGFAAVGTLWFLGFLVIIPFVPLRTDGIPVPWYGRVWVAGVTVVLAGIFAMMFRSLGDPEARRYFGVFRSGSGVAEPDAAPDRGGS